MVLSFDHTSLGQRVVFGSGRSVENVRDAVIRMNANRILLICEPFAAETGDSIAACTPVISRIDDIVQHVPAENARAAIEQAVSARTDAIVTVGGGSATGLAKVVARDTGLPIVAVPTTFAGSEATNVWGITESARKVTGVDDRVLPKTIVYDPKLFASFPTSLAVASGLNAIAHAVDGLWAPRADPINRALGTEALRALVPALRGLGDDSGSSDAIEQALYGAYLAAVAFASAGSGIHHKICHVLGGSYGLPHAETHAVVLPYVAAFNSPFAADAADRVSMVLNHAPPGRGLFDLRNDLGITGSLRALGLQESDVAGAAALVLAAVPASNPRPASVKDLQAIIHAAWAGEPVQ